jgi:hypothetical protein
MELISVRELFKNTDKYAGKEIPDWMSDKDIY